MAGTPMIVITSEQVARDLFEKRSAVYSDRPLSRMINDLIGLHWHFGFMQYGTGWRQRRRVFHQYFNANATLKYRSKVIQATKEFLVNLINQCPESPTEDLLLMAGSLTLALVYGLDIRDKGDPYLHTAEEAMSAISAAGNAGSYIIDFIPLLKQIPTWLPGAKFKRDALRWRKFVMGLVEDPCKAVDKDMENDTPKSSITASLLAKLKDTSDRAQVETVIRHSMGAAYQAGSHTTVATIEGFFLAMLLHPEVLRRAQEEVDVVVGQERLPNLDDQPFLPYVSAIVKEVLRWRPIAPLAVPHRVTVEDVYAGYRIPAGAIVVGNAWAMLHDENTYPNPERFFPERFLTAEGKLSPNVREPDAAFGFGRRICPGRYLAWESVWITAAMSLATLKIEKMVDQEGNVMEPTGNYSSGLVRRPLPFKCSIKARSPTAEALIRASVDRTDEDGP